MLSEIKQQQETDFWAASKAFRKASNEGVGLKKPFRALERPYYTICPRRGPLFELIDRIRKWFVRLCPCFFAGTENEDSKKLVKKEFRACKTLYKEALKIASQPLAKRGIPAVGLENESNNCWCIAFFQNLVHIPPLRKMYLEVAQALQEGPTEDNRDYFDKLATNYVAYSQRKENETTAKELKFLEEIKKTFPKGIFILPAEESASPETVPTPSEFKNALRGHIKEGLGTLRGNFEKLKKNCPDLSSRDIFNMVFEDVLQKAWQTTLLDTNPVPQLSPDDLEKEIVSEILVGSVQENIVSEIYRVHLRPMEPSERPELLTDSKEIALEIGKKHGKALKEALLSYKTAVKEGKASLGPEVIQNVRLALHFLSPNSFSQSSRQQEDAAEALAVLFGTYKDLTRNDPVDLTFSLTETTTYNCTYGPLVESVQDNRQYPAPPQIPESIRRSENIQRFISIDLDNSNQENEGEDAAEALTVLSAAHKDLTKNDPVDLTFSLTETTTYNCTDDLLAEPVQDNPQYPAPPQIPESILRPENIQRRISIDLDNSNQVNEGIDFFRKYSAYLCGQPYKDYINQGEVLSQKQQKAKVELQEILNNAALNKYAPVDETIISSSAVLQAQSLLISLPQPPPKGKVPLLDLLRETLHPDPKNGPSKIYMHEKQLRKYQTVEQKSQFRHPPSYLTLSLKRFMFDEATQQSSKDNTSVDVPLQLILPEDTVALPSSPAEGEAPATYELHSFLIHRGKTLGKGHYISYWKDYPSKKWIEGNDGNVTLISKDAFLEAASEAYVLFYRNTSTSFEDDFFSAAVPKES